MYSYKLGVYIPYVHIIIIIITDLVSVFARRHCRAVAPQNGVYIVYVSFVCYIMCLNIIMLESCLLFCSCLVYVICINISLMSVIVFGPFRRSPVHHALLSLLSSLHLICFFETRGVFTFTTGVFAPEVDEEILQRL